MVGWPGITHVQKNDFQPVIDQALALPRFEADADKGTIMVGFARNAILDKADDIIAPVKAGRVCVHDFILV